LVVVGQGQTARVYLLSFGGRLFRFDPTDLSVRAHAEYDTTRSTYANHVP
jgi:hypothetical protein